ncbi:MAG TPA: glutamate--tRNA ligase [Bacteroidales bacterium]|nr:glutamate--tRNA ligase [Bacteroidales bacterium]
MKKTIRVRFAPSPTGPLHIGGVRTALYNYLFAKKHNGTFILRIEDTDQTRFVPGAEDYIIKSLNWCGINIDEGVGVNGPYAPYRQSERKHIYEKYANTLLEKNLAYLAFDTPEELENMRKNINNTSNKPPQYNAQTRLSMKNSLSLTQAEVKKLIDSGTPYVIRIKIPENETIILNDIVRGTVKINSSTLDDKVLFKSDGLPTYHLANVVDDYLMKITHVIRGEEWLPSAPLHILLYRYLGWENEMPQFAHLPLLLKPEGNGKLSKRDGDRLGFPVFPIEWKDPVTGEIYMGYRETGYLPQAFINMLALLGWNPGTEQEIFSMTELIHNFSLENINKAGARFDPHKAKWFNHYYIQQTPDEQLVDYFKKELEKDNIYPDKEYLLKVTKLVKERVSLIKDFKDHALFFFISPQTYDTKLIKDKWNENSPIILSELISILTNINDFTETNIETAIKTFINEKNLKTGQIMNVLRLCLVGSNKGPSLFSIIALIGKNETIKRIQLAIDKITNYNVEQ